MSEENKAIVRHFFEEIWNGGNLEVADEIIDGGYRQTDITTGHRRIAGPEIPRHEVVAYRSATDDLRFDIEELIAEGDKVVARWRATAMPKGEDATQVAARGVSINRIVDGKIADIRLYSLAFVADTAWLPGVELP